MFKYTLVISRQGVLRDGLVLRLVEEKPNLGGKMKVITMKQLLEAGVHFGHQAKDGIKNG